MRLVTKSPANANTCSFNGETKPWNQRLSRSDTNSRETRKLEPATLQREQRTLKLSRGSSETRRLEHATLQWGRKSSETRRLEHATLQWEQEILKISRKSRNQKARTYDSSTDHGQATSRRGQGPGTPNSRQASQHAPRTSRQTKINTVRGQKLS